MRLGDLVERVRAVDRDGEAVCRDRVEVGLEYIGGQVGGVPAVRGEPDARRDVLDRVEVCEGPLVAARGTAEEARGTADAVDSTSPAS